MPINLSVRECVRYGWETFKKRPWFLVGVTLLLAVINMLVPSPDKNASIPVTVALGLLSMLIGVFLQLAGQRFALRAHDNVETARLADLWAPELYPKYLGAAILVFLVAGAAFCIPLAATVLLFPVIGFASLIALVLLVPAAILAISLVFVGYLVIDRGLGPIAAFKESVRITKGHRGKLLLLSLVIVLLNLLGLICLIIGLLVSMPVTVLAVVHAYRLLSGTTSVRSVPAA